MVKVRSFTITISSMMHIFFSIWQSSCGGSLSEQELENLWRVTVAEALSVYSSHQLQSQQSKGDGFVSDSMKPRATTGSC